MRITARIQAITVIAEYIRYTFNGLVGFVLSVVALSALMCLTVLAYRYQPLRLSAVIIFCITAGLFLTVMLINLIKFRAYKKHYRSVFSKGV
jgi:hypothetical protein